MADFFDADGAEVNGEDIESGFSGAEHDGGGHFKEFRGVRTGEDFSEDSERTGTAQGAHESHGEEVDGESDRAEKGSQDVFQEKKGARITEDGEGGEHGDEEGHDAGGDGEALFGAIDKFLVDFDPASECDAEGEDEEEGDGEGGGGIQGGADARGGCGSGRSCGLSRGGLGLGFGVGAALFSGFDDTGDAGFFEHGLA